jgi:hypothetical protein
VSYEPIIAAQVTEPTEADVARAEIAMAKVFARVLGHYYPGYMWGVKVDARQKFALIQIAAIMRTEQVFMVPLEKLQNENDINKFMRLAGGEILERFRLSRGKIQEDAFLNLREARKRIPLQSKMPE